jgi:hypothetical protein
MPSRDGGTEEGQREGEIMTEEDTQRTLERGKVQAHPAAMDICSTVLRSGTCRASMEFQVEKGGGRRQREG